MQTSLCNIRWRELLTGYHTNLGHGVTSAMTKKRVTLCDPIVFFVFFSCTRYVVRLWPSLAAILLYFTGQA